MKKWLNYGTFGLVIMLVGGISLIICLGIGLFNIDFFSMTWLTIFLGLFVTGIVFLMIDANEEAKRRTEFYRDLDNLIQKVEEYNKLIYKWIIIHHLIRMCESSQKEISEN